MSFINSAEVIIGISSLLKYFCLPSELAFSMASSLLVVFVLMEVATEDVVYCLKDEACLLKFL